MPQTTMVAASERCERCDGLMGPSPHVTCTCELVSERELRETRRRGSEWSGGDGRRGNEERIERSDVGVVAGLDVWVCVCVRVLLHKCCLLFDCNIL